MLHEDKQMTSLMLKNGRNYCSGNSRCTSIRHFFVKSRVEKTESMTECYLTQCVIVHFFAKLIKGKLIIKLREVIRECKPAPTLR